MDMENLQPYKHKILFSANVGSHMWGMNHDKSDFDVMSVFVYPSEDILLGKRVTNKDRTYGDVDEKLMEIGHFIGLLKECNINALWCMLSPIVVFDPHGMHKELKRIVEMNFSRLVYHSLNGLARHNIKRFIVKGDRESAKYQKKLNIVGRTLKFGINLLKYAEYEFTSKFPYHIEKEEDLHILLTELEEAREDSCLPEKPQHIKLYDEFLLKIRYYDILIKELEKYAVY